jgi:hypothetical protein
LLARRIFATSSLVTPLLSPDTVAPPRRSLPKKLSSLGVLPGDIVVMCCQDLAILRDRSFALLLSARTAAVLGGAFGPVALAFGVLALPVATGATLSVVVAAESIAMVAGLIGGIALDVLSVMWDTTMQREIPEESLSRVSSYDALGSLMFGPIGLLLAGPAVVPVGVDAALLISAAITALASVAALCSPGVRRLEWTRTEAPLPIAPLGEPSNQAATAEALA